MLVIRCNVAVRTACEHQVHVQMGKICFRDGISPAASLRWYCTKEIRGFPGLRVDRRCWRITSIAGGLRHPELKKWLKKCNNWFQCDRRMTIVELEQEVGISHGSIHVILSDSFKMRCVGAKFVQRQLTTSDGMSHDGRWRSVWEKYAVPNVSHKDHH